MKCVKLTRIDEPKNIEEQCVEFLFFDKNELFALAISLIDSKIDNDPILAEILEDLLIFHR